MYDKIELNLENSNYRFNFKGLTFVFSSEFNLRRFSERIEDYIKQETMKLKYRYGNLIINFDLFLSIVLYKKLERRGFLIYDGEDQEIELKEDTLFLICYKSKENKHY